MENPTSPTPATRAPSAKARAATALLLLLPIPSLGTAASMFWWPGTALGKTVFILAKVWMVALLLLWLLWVERERIS